MFQSSTYIKRRSKLKTRIGSGILLLLGNSESPMNYLDNTYHFRQDSSFLYFFGLDHPDLVGLIDIDNNKEIIFGNDLTIDDIVWMGVKPTINERASQVGISETYPLTKLDSYIKDAQQKNRTIHFLPPYRPENKIKLFELLSIKPPQTNELASVELIKAVVDQRNYKSDEEIAEIEKAVNVTVDMHLAGMRMARPGMKESEVAAAVYEIALAAGGNISFPIIATIHGETLHNHYHGNTIQSGDLFLLDAGAETPMHYAGDMSSTFPVDKTFTEQQKEIYNVALAAHEAAIAMLKPGISNKEVHLKACITIAKGMKDLGFMKGNMEEAVHAGAHALFFPCGTGHMMGMDVHDMEDLGEVWVGYGGEPKSTQFGLKSLRLGRKLEPGFVLTIEPGVYFIPDLIDMWRSENKFNEFINWDKVEQYKNFGG
ncbi:MAG: aminopeptidase P N-terminal domain-containing protein, partial [Bacteroidales bacterium]|nr:aminopeptidase P N-terminal domain-containing protein [Bacteroidales bacterium]